MSEGRSKPIPWTNVHHREIVKSTARARCSSASLGIPGRDRDRERRERLGISGWQRP